MILRALYDYYHRSREALAPEGLEYKEIAFAIVIDNNGNFKRFEQMLGCSKLVIKNNGRTGIKSLPNHLWDNWAYVLGFSSATLLIGKEDLETEKKAKRDKELIKNLRCNKAFVEYVDSLANSYPEDSDLKAISMFYRKDYDYFALAQESDQWDAIKKNLTKNISFIIEGELQVIAEKETILSYFFNNRDSANKVGNTICLVTGEHCSPVLTFTKIQLGKFSDTKLVSFQTNQGYDSYGKEQGENAAMSKEAEFAIATALKKLVSFDSHNRFIIGNRIYAFWASKSSSVGQLAEESIFSLFSSLNNEDDPDRSLEYIKSVFESIYTGKNPIQDNEMFYILGLFAANKARIAVSYWEEISVKEFAGKILQHIEDMAIAQKNGGNTNYWGLFNMMKEISLKRDISNIPPNLPDAVVKSIFQGAPYPASLFQACIRRIRAEICKEVNGKKVNPVNTTRIAIIKAYLNRLIDNNKKIQIMLDKENNNQGYLCGRLFAVLENLQYAANKQDTIRSSYMNAASSTPAAVFSTILKLSNSHFGKLAKDKKGLAMYFDTQKEEIIAMLRDFPETLSLQDQGRFFLGYYHQKNYKENNENEE